MKNETQCQSARFRLIGEVSLRDVVGDIAVEIELEDEALDPEADRAKFVARAVVPRKAYGVNWNPMFDFVPVFIGHDVHIEGIVCVVRQRGG